MSRYRELRLRRIRRLRALARLARMKRISRRGYSIPFVKYAARYAIKALEPAWIPARQIEAGRKAIKRCVGRRTKIWVFPHEKPFPMNKMETRIPTDYILHVKPGYVLFEISASGVPETIARRALALAAYRMPIKTEFIYVIFEYI